MNTEKQQTPGRPAAGKDSASSRTDEDKQGISNRPGDEEPENGVDRAPGTPQIKEPQERNR